MQNIILKALNKYCQLDSDFYQKSESLNNKIIGLHFLKLDKKCFFMLHNNAWQAVNEATPDVLISGTPLRLLFLACADNPQALFADDVSISGDLELGQKVFKMFNNLDIDWEEKLSQYIGDTAAFQLGKFGRFLCQRTKEIKNSFKLNVTDYVQEEKLFLPPKEELENFFQDIDQLRMDVDRFSARISALENLTTQR